MRVSCKTFAIAWRIWGLGVMTVSCKTFAIAWRIGGLGVMTVSCKTFAISRRTGETGVGVILYTFIRGLLLLNLDQGADSRDFSVVFLIISHRCWDSTLISLGCNKLDQCFVGCPYSRLIRNTAFQRLHPSVFSGGDCHMLGLFQRPSPSLYLAVCNRPNTVGSPRVGPPHL